MAPKLQTPANGAKDIPTTTTLTWSDPGALTERTADNFDVAIFQGGSQVDTVTALAATSYPIPAGLYWGTKKFTFDPERASGVVTGGTRSSDPMGNFDDVVDLYANTPVLLYTVIDTGHPGPGLVGVIKGPLKGKE